MCNIDHCHTHTYKEREVSEMIQRRKIALSGVTGKKRYGKKKKKKGKTLGGGFALMYSRNRKNK